MNRVMITYNYRYLAAGIILIIPVLGSIVEIFDTEIELGMIHLYSIIWVAFIAALLYFSFTNEVYEDIKTLLVKNGFFKKAVEWKDITAVSDIKEPRLAYMNAAFTRYRKLLKIQCDKKTIKIYYKFDEDVDNLKELIKSKLKTEIEKHAYKADILHRVLDMIID